MTLKKNKYIDRYLPGWNIVIIVILFIFFEIIINPSSDFCVADDWAWAENVKWWLNGNFKTHSFASMTLIAHTFWGWLITSIIGYSFFKLKISIMILALLGLFFLMKISGVLSNINKIIIALFLLVNPLFCSLTNTFMTDISFLVFCIISFYFFINFLQNETKLSLILFSVFSVLSVLIRQNGFALSISAIITSFLMFSFKERKSLLYFLFPFLISLIFHLLTKKFISNNIYLFNEGNFGSISDSVLNKIINFNVKDFIKFALIVFFTIWLYLSVFFLPFILTKKMKITFFHGCFTFIIFCCYIILFIYWKKELYSIFFNKWNIIFPIGIGPSCLPDIEEHNIVFFSEIPKSILTIGYLVLSLLASWFISTLLFSIITFLKNTTNKTFKKNVFIFSASFFIINLSVLILYGKYYDRYLLPLIFSLIVVILSINYISSNLISKTTFIVFLFISTVFSVLGTHDYMELSRKKKYVADYLIKSGVELKNINCGTEFCGTYFYHDINFRKKQNGYWYNYNAKYILTLKPVNSYTVVNEINLNKYLFTNSNNKLLLLKK